MISFEYFVVKMSDTLRFRCYESCNCRSMVMTIQAIHDTINNVEFNFLFRDNIKSHSFIGFR